MGDDKKTSVITTQTALYGAAGLAVALLGWIGSIMQENIERNRLDINQIQLSITAIETKLDDSNRPQPVAPEAKP